MPSSEAQGPWSTFPAQARLRLFDDVVQEAEWSRRSSQRRDLNGPPSLTPDERRQDLHLDLSTLSTKGRGRRGWIEDRKPWDRIAEGLSKVRGLPPRASATAIL